MSGKIEKFFASLKETDTDITIRNKDSAIKISGDGIGGMVGPSTLQKGYDTIKSIAAAKSIEYTDKKLENMSNNKGKTYQIEDNMTLSEESEIER